MQWLRLLRLPTTLFENEIIAKLRNINFYLVVSGLERDLQRETTRTVDKSQATNHGIAIAFRSTVTVILVSWWQLVARLKTHDPRHQLGWSAADWVANNLFQMNASLAPLICAQI